MDRIHAGHVMKKLVVLIILVGILSGCISLIPQEEEDLSTSLGGIPTSTSGPDVYPEAFQPVRLAWFYKPPADENLDHLVEQYDFFILTRKDEIQRDHLLQSGVDQPILQYLLFPVIMDPGSCSDQPFHNQVAMRAGDFCDIETNHPDWFLRGAVGELLVNENGYTMMDPGSEGWRVFWLERARESQEAYGWNGVFLDNVEASLLKRLENGRIPAMYLTDASYQDAVEDNLRFLYETYFEPSRIPLYANIIAVRDPDIWYRYLRYLDGAMIENFAVGWRAGDESPAEWEMQLSLAEGTQQAGKDIILVSQGEEFDHERQQFALASYLLVNNGQAYFRYIHHSSYDMHWWYDSYALDLGVPQGTRYQVGDAWVRDFTRGRVVVDPAARQADILLTNP